MYFRAWEGGEGKKKKRCILFIFPWYILCMSVVASTARYSWTLGDIGYARTVQPHTGEWWDAVSNSRWPLHGERFCVVLYPWAAILQVGSTWPRAANTRAAVLASSHTSNQHWTRLLQRHKPRVILLLVSFSWTFPLLLGLFQSRIQDRRREYDFWRCILQYRVRASPRVFFFCFPLLQYWSVIASLHQ